MVYFHARILTEFGVETAAELEKSLLLTHAKGKRCHLFQQNIVLFFAEMAYDEIVNFTPSLLFEAYRTRLRGVDYFVFH